MNGDMTASEEATARAPATQRVILACDESGAKGYADQDEQRPGEVGVFAGLMVPEELLTDASRRLEDAVSTHRAADGKLHITDLDAAAQTELRTRIFDVIRELQLPCFWYAIHVAGFRDHHLRLEEIHAQTRHEIATRNPNPRVKRGSARNEPELLHNALFQGLYSNIVAFIEERRPGQVEIEVRTDRIDAPIAELFRKESAELLDDSPRTSTVSGYDTVDKKVVRGSITTSMTYPASMKIETEVTALTITPTGDDDPLVVAADVIANSLSHLFHQRSSADLYSDLNRPEAVRDHPLADALDSYRNWGGPDLMGDRLYRHPKAPPLP